MAPPLDPRGGGRAASDPVSPLPAPRCPAHPEAKLVPAVAGARDQFFTVTEERWSYQRCAECGALILDPRPVPTEIGPYYAGYYTDRFLARLEGQTQGGKRAFGSGRVRALGFLRGLDRIGFGSPVGKRLLDVGAGLGAFARYARDLGQLVVRGVDFSAKTAEFARRIHGLEIDVNELRTQNYPEGSFDLVTAWHYLEHVYDPLSELKEMRRVVAPGGVVMVETPTPSLATKIFGPSWMYLMPPTHLYHYRPQTLVALFQQAGLEVVRVRQPWFPGEWAGSLLFTLGVRNFTEVLFGGGTSLRERAIRWAFFGMMPLDIPWGALVAAIFGGSNLRVYARRPAE